jgi:hypothetical protein
LNIKFLRWEEIEAFKNEITKKEESLGKEFTKREKEKKEEEEAKIVLFDWGR